MQSQAATEPVGMAGTEPRLSGLIPLYFHRCWILLSPGESSDPRTREGPSMHHRNCVLHGVLRQVPWRKFDALVEAHRADKHIRRLPTRTQFASLAFAQLCGISGLRETVTALNSQTNRLYHLGARPVARSTLSDANTQR